MALVGIQAFIAAFITANFLSLLLGDIEHVREDGIPFLRTGVYLGLATVAALITGAVLAMKRVTWSWHLIMCAEGLLLLSGLIVLFAGALFAALPAVALAAAVIVLLLPAQAAQWFRRR